MKYTPKLRRNGNPQVPEQGGSSGPAGWACRCCGGCGGDREGTALTATCGAPARWLTEGSTLCMSWEWGSSKRWGTKAASPCRWARETVPLRPRASASKMNPRRRRQGAEERARPLWWIKPACAVHGWRIQTSAVQERQTESSRKQCFPASDGPRDRAHPRTALCEALLWPRVPGASWEWCFQ